MTSRNDVLPTPVSPQVPRRLLPKRGAAAGGCGLWFARLFILPHVIVGAGFIGCAVLYPVWALLGTDTQATVVGRSIRRGESWTHHIEYVYKHGGRQYRGSSEVDEAYYNTLRTLDAPEKVEAEPPPTVRVRHLGVGRLRYASALPPGAGMWSSLGFILVFAVFWNAILSVFVILLWIMPWRSRRLYKWGKATRGRITGKRSRASTPRGHKLEYEFALPGGRKASGRMGVASAMDWSQASVGEAVTVLYLGRNGRSSVIYEYGDYECGWTAAAQAQNPR